MLPSRIQWVRRSAVLGAVVLGMLCPALPGATNAAKSRVVQVVNPGATHEFQPQADVVQKMVDQGVARLTGQADPVAAWRSLVATQDVVGIKVYAVPGRYSGTRPAVVAAVARSLMQAGVPANQIIIWDKKREPLLLAGYLELAQQLGVQIEAVNDEGYDSEHYYDRALIGNLVFGDLEFDLKGQSPGTGRRSFVAKVLTKKITRVIVISPLLNHNDIEVTGHLYNLAMGSVDNTIRFESSASQLMEAVPEVYAMELLSDRVALCLTDALLAQYQGRQRSLLHYSATLNQLWFSKDPLALDVLARDELETQRKAARLPQVKVKNELFNNAELLELGHANRKNIQLERIQ